MEQKIFLISYRRRYTCDDNTECRSYSSLIWYDGIQTMEVAADNMAEAIKAIPDNDYLDDGNHLIEILSISDITEIFNITGDKYEKKF